MSLSVIFSKTLLCNTMTTRTSIPLTTNANAKAKARYANPSLCTQNPQKKPPQNLPPPAMSIPNPTFFLSPLSLVLPLSFFPTPTQLAYSSGIPGTGGSLSPFLVGVPNVLPKTSTYPLPSSQSPQCPGIPAISAIKPIVFRLYTLEGLPSTLLPVPAPAGGDRD